jgi:hypothetical protein
VDGCAQKLVLKDSGTEAADIRFLQLLLSGELISNRKSQGLLSGLFGKCESGAALPGLLESGHSEESAKFW